MDGKISYRAATSDTPSTTDVVSSGEDFVEPARRHYLVSRALMNAAGMSPCQLSCILRRTARGISAVARTRVIPAVAIVAISTSLAAAGSETGAGSNPADPAPVVWPSPDTPLPTHDLNLTYDSLWTGRPRLRLGHPAISDDTSLLTAGMNAGATRGRDNPPNPLKGKPWPTFGNYGSLSSLWVMPNEDGMELCGAKDLVDWDAGRHAVVLRARPLSRCVSDQLPAASKARYMSGNLTSFRAFAQRFGVFEIEARLANGKGMWPAFWLLPETGGWPPEIDVIEQLGNNAAELARDPRGVRSSHVYHWGLVAKLAPGTGKRIEAGDYARGLPDLTADFHRYAVDWGPRTIAFYFDRRLVGVAPTPPELQSVRMYWLAGLAVGGAWAGAPDDPVDAALYVRRVAVWQRASYEAIGSNAP